MADCELLGTCIFFNNMMAEMPSTSEIVKFNYCRGAHEECARYLVFKAQGRERVPKDLFPFQGERAIEIIKKMVP